MDPNSGNLKEAGRLLKQSKFPVVLTGAGISSESGIPTFRGPEGLWKSYRPEDLANFAAFQKDPELVWEWYNWRRDIILHCKPNAGHLAITKLQSKFPEMAVITQNVDGLHLLAGTKNVLEMHGNIFQAKCSHCNTISEHSTTNQKRPICATCGHILRPNIVWFGESLDPAIMLTISKQLIKTDILLVIGTSGVVYPAAGFAEEVYDHGGKILEINPEPNIPFALSLKGKSGEILPALYNILN